MAWFERLKSAGVPALHNMEPVWPFEAGHTYHQVDLDSRDTVEGVAHYFRETGQPLGFFATRAAHQIEEANGGADELGKPYAVYTGIDEFDCLIAYVYEKDI